MAEAIYGGISGAKLDSSLQQWVVPCDAEVDMALQFGCVSSLSSSLAKYLLYID